MQFDTLSPQSKAGYRVLVAEDCPDSRMLITEMLTQSGLQVTSVTNGRECCEGALQALQEHKPFDVILMDIQMPEMDGHAAARHLRANGYTLPIVAMTARTTVNDEDSTIAAGCNAHISKLSGGSTLVAEVIKQVKANVKESQSLTSQIPILPVVPDLIRKKPEFARSALSLIERMPRLVEAIQRAVNARDFNAVKVATVDLGSAPMLGYSIMADYLREMQTAADENNAAHLTALMPKFERMARQIIEGRSQIAKIAEKAAIRH